MNDFLNEINAIPVIDSHHHLRSHDQCQPYDSVIDFVTYASYLICLLPHADRALAAKVQDKTLDERVRWNYFLQLWPFVRCTGFGQTIVRILRFWKLGEELNDVSFEAMHDFLQSQSPEKSREAYLQVGIERSITHFLGHPVCGGLENVKDYLEGRLAFDSAFYPLLGTLPLHEYFDRSGIETVGCVSGMAITSLADLTRAINEIAERTIKKGAIGFKDHAAYSRGLAFGAPDKLAAEQEFGCLMAGEHFEHGARNLSDYLFW